MTKKTINQKDSVFISGKVNYKDSGFDKNNLRRDRPLFTFEDVEIRYPEVINYITRVDTILETVTITEQLLFYQDHWFWGFVGSLVLLVLAIV